MSPKNLSWHCYALVALLVSTVPFITSCNKDNVSPSSSTLSSSATTPGTKLPASLITTTNVAMSGKAYIVSNVINLTGVHDLTISGKSIAGGNVPCISLTNCSNIHITNCRLVNSTTTGVNLYKCVNIVVDSSYISNVSTGVYASTCQSIKVLRNQMKNMVGPMPRGQFVQFNTVSGAGNQVIANKCENIMGSSTPEDAISMYMTNGTATSPVIISWNWIRGGGPSKTGGGIILGDDGGSHQTAENNTLVNPGQYGIGVAGGTNLEILNNKIYAAQNTFTNVGVCVWNQYTNISASSGITASGNQVNWTNSAGALNPDWNAGNCGTVTGWSSNTWGATFTSSILPATIITLN